MDLLPLLQIFGEKCFQFIEGNRIFPAAVIEIGMDSSGNDHQFLVVRVPAAIDHIGIGITAEIAGMGVLAMNQENSAADLIRVLEDRLVDEGLTADHVPAAVGIQGAGMIAPRGLVVVVVVLYKERRVFRKWIDYPAAKLIRAVFKSSSLWAHIATFFA